MHWVHVDEVWLKKCSDGQEHIVSLCAEQLDLTPYPSSEQFVHVLHEFVFESKYMSPVEVLQDLSEPVAAVHGVLVYSNEICTVSRRSVRLAGVSMAIVRTHLAYKSPFVLCQTDSE